ncbi:hypothetical protein BKA83DRAFT_4128656 [Pisolithus microcarpus]|nr:hypothetical protein BKA83DRAFT_4128656 [Pisolithus microcarpus]
MRNERETSENVMLGQEMLSSVHTTSVTCQYIILVLAFSSAQGHAQVHVLMHSDLRSVLPNFRLPRILILADTLNPPLSLRNFPTIPNPHAMIQRIWLAPLKFIHRLVVVGERGGARCGRSLVSGDITERCGCVVDTELIGATSGFGHQIINHSLRDTRKTHTYPKTGIIESVLNLVVHMPLSHRPTSGSLAPADVPVLLRTSSSVASVKQRLYQGTILDGVNRSSNTTFAAVNTTIRVLVIKIDPSSISMPYHTELVVVVDNLSSTLTARGLSNPDPKPGPEQSHVSSLPPSVAPRLSDEF